MHAIDFTLPYIDKGENYQLKNSLGKIVVITFWTSWCPECSGDLMLKEKLYQTLDTNLVEFITINVVGRERDPNEGIRFYKDFLTQPTLVDRGLETYRKYNCQGVPTTVIINQEGEIILQQSNQVKPLEIVQSIHSFI